MTFALSWWIKFCNNHDYVAYMYCVIAMWCSILLIQRTRMVLAGNFERKSMCMVWNRGRLELLASTIHVYCTMYIVEPMHICNRDFSLSLWTLNRSHRPWFQSFVWHVWKTETTSVMACNFCSKLPASRPSTIQCITQPTRAPPVLSKCTCNTTILYYK